MNKIFVIATTLSASLLLLSCGNNSLSQEEKDRKIKEQQDSLALVEKAKQDSINAAVPDVKVNIYARKDVGYDSEGYPVEMGKVVAIKDFQEKKEYQLKGGDYIEKIEISGQSADMTLQFFAGNSNKLMHEEKAISLNGTKTYTTYNPLAEKDKYFQEWLYTNRDGLIIKVLYKDKGIFEGKINPAK
jgi:hypothetical protein